MKILPVKIQNNPSFKSIVRTVYKDKNGEYAITESDLPPDGTHLYYRNYTCFFRRDLNSNGWKNFAKQMAEEFKSAQKVNVYDFACSDGSEAYSLAISLIEELGQEDAKKFLPVQASDIDNKMIEIAKQGNLKCTPKDIDEILKITKDNLEKYFQEPNCDKDSDKTTTIQANSFLKSAVEFKQANILEELDKIEPSNSLILCRNFIPYLDSDSVDLLFSKLLKINSSSRVVFGKFDERVIYKTPAFLENFQFALCACSSVFQKKDRR